MNPEEIFNRAIDLVVGEFDNIDSLYHDSDPRTPYNNRLIDWKCTRAYGMVDLISEVFEIEEDEVFDLIDTLRGSQVVA